MKRIRNRITIAREKLPGHTHPMAQALFYMMLLCATIHLVISLFMAIATNDINYASIWHIIGLDMVFRPSHNDVTTALLGVPIMVIPWILITKLLAQHDKQKITLYEDGNEIKD